MSMIMFSNSGVHYEGGPGGALMGLYVPGPGQQKTFSDLQGNNVREMAERYGKPNQRPLWRLERGQVVVYGTLLPELAERREALQVYLPEQILPASCTAFYFVFGHSWLVHGVRVVNDDGQVEWAVSRLPVKSGQNPANMVVEALSERLLDAKEDTYCIAVTQNDKALNELKEKLLPFEQEAIRFESLKPARGEAPLYKHQNYSLLMMTIALLALMIVLASAGWWLMQTMELEQRKKQVEDIRRQIGQIELNERVGHIRNPQKILLRMDKSLQRAPSSILNVVAQLGAKFGRLGEVELNLREQAGGRVDPSSGLMLEDQEKLLTVGVQLDKMANEFLVDQEKLAKVLLIERPWIREIKSYNRRAEDESARLEVTIRVE